MTWGVGIACVVLVIVLLTFIVPNMPAWIVQLEIALLALAVILRGRLITAP